MQKTVRIDNFTYTAAEATTAKYTLGDVNRAVEAALTNKRHSGICIDAILKLDRDSRLTLPELNRVVDQVVWDTMSRA